MVFPGQGWNTFVGWRQAVCTVITHVLSILWVTGGCQSVWLSVHHLLQPSSPLTSVYINEKSGWLTGPLFIRTVSTVIHAITFLISIDPVHRVAAVEDQVSWKAIGQIIYKRRYLKIVKCSNFTQQQLDINITAEKLIISFNSIFTLLLSPSMPGLKALDKY